MIVSRLTVIKSPKIFETFVTVVNELPKSLSGITRETFGKALCKFNLYFLSLNLLTYDLSKSGVSSVVVLIGDFVAEKELIARLDADPILWADADDA